MPGVLSCGAYVPFRRLDRSAIAEVFGGAPGKGTRAVASYDEDTTSMAVEAARACLRSAASGAPEPDALWFSTTVPTYVDKTNATTVHAALRLDGSCGAYDANGSVRSAVGALLAALHGSGTTLLTAADIRTGLPTSADEADGGDASAALLVGAGDPIAELVGSASVTEEFTDRWRVPGEQRSQLWEDRFGEQAYVALGEQAWSEALKAAELAARDVTTTVVVGTHTRAVARVAKKLGASTDGLQATVGSTGAAQPALALTAALESAQAGDVIALVVLSDGADVLVFRASPAIADHRPARPVTAQVATGGPVTYGRFLSWRGAVTVEPPNRPEPARPSSSAAARGRDWKYALVGDDGAPLADATGTIATFTVDRLVYSPSPPVVFAVVDFDAGSRLPCELTDVDADAVAVGDRVEMTFRRLHTAGGIANYFWKARPLRVEAS